MLFVSLFQRLLCLGVVLLLVSSSLEWDRECVCVFLGVGGFGVGLGWVNVGGRGGLGGKR